MKENLLFEKFNIITHDNKKYRDFFTGYDISERINSGDYLSDFIIEGNPNLDTLSYSLYGDASYYWVIILINNIQDAFFDLPLSQEELKKITMMRLEEYCSDNKFDSITSEKYILENYFTVFTRLEEENNLKRHIKVIRPEKLNSFLSLVKESI